jgi:glutamate synthase domain-containing protein 1
MSNADLGDDLAKLYPVVERDMSDSGSFDNVLEFLVPTTSNLFDLQ